VRKLLVPLLVVLLFIPMTGCMKHTFTVGRGAPLNSEVVYDHWHHHWIFGLIGDLNVDINHLCPSGNATIHEETSFLNGLIAALIGGLYNPTTVTVRCAGGDVTEIDLSADDVHRIVTDPRFLDLVEEEAPDRLLEVMLAQDREAEDAPRLVRAQSAAR
jgi:hypothetical protein